MLLYQDTLIRKEKVRGKYENQGPVFFITAVRQDEEKEAEGAEVGEDLGSVQTRNCSKEDKGKNEM